MIVVGLIVLNFALLLLTFYTLCIICDEYLVPAVEVFIKQFKVPEEVAAVTLVAFGSAAPELFLNSVSAVRHTSDLSLSAILGSGMIAFGLIPPLCFLSIHRDEVFLKLSPILRECSFYVIGLSLFLLALNDGKISTNEAFCIVSVYFLYVGLVCYMYLSSSNGLSAIAQLKQRMFSANALNNNTGSSNVVFSATTTAAGGGNGPASPMNRDIYMHDYVDEEQQGHMYGNGNEEQQALLASQTVTAGGGEYRGGDFSGGNSDSRAAALAGGGFSPLQLLSPRAADGDDVETAVVESTHTSAVERTVHYVNHCISAPIQYVLSKILPQLHPVEAPPPLNVASSSNFSDNDSSNNTTYSDQLCERQSLLPSPYTTVASPLRIRSISDNNGNSNSNNSLSSSGSSKQQQQPQGEEAINRAELVPLWRAITVLFVSIVCIGVLASGIVSFSEAIVRHLGVDSSTLGATLVALGAEIPDTISSIAMARSGYYDGAIAGAIGSQVINISLGVGLPSLFVCFTGDGYLRISPDQGASLWLLTCLLFIVIASYVAVTIPVVLMYTQRVVPEMTAVSKAGAVIQIFVWCSVYVVFIYNNESTR